MEVPLYKSETAPAEIDGLAGFAVTNTYHPYGALAVEKHLAAGATDAAREIGFSFVLNLWDSEGNFLQSEYYYEKYDASGAVTETGMIGNGGEFTLKAEERLLIPDTDEHQGTR